MSDVSRFAVRRMRDDERLARDPDSLQFQSALVRIGSFRCPVSHPHFRDAGTITTQVFAFPRSVVWIEHEGQEPFVGDFTRASLYNPGQIYTRRAISTAGDRSDWFGVSPSLLREILVEFDPARADSGLPLFRYMYSPCDAPTYLRQRTVFEYIRNHPEPDTLRVEEQVVELLSGLVSAAYAQRPAPHRAPRRHREIVEHTRAYLSQHFARKESLADVAAAVGCSVFHLCRLFRRETGLTLHAFRHELRLRRSLECVADSPGDLLSVALALGYSSHSHFTAAFNASFGVTPSSITSPLSNSPQRQRRP
jgi:AraC family transcriptional regulator